MTLAPRSPASRGAACALLALLLAPAGAARAGEAVPDWAAVGELFRDRCVMCHSHTAAARGLRLDSYAGAVAGGDNGPVLVAGDAAASELLRRLLGESRPRMPFLSRPLSPAEIALIERWIAAGLPEHAPPAPDADLATRPP